VVVDTVHYQILRRALSLASTIRRRIFGSGELSNF
jgi:hypothetical protein